MSILTSLTRIWLTRSLRPFTFTGEHDPHPAYQDASGLGLYIHIPFCRSLCSFCPYCRVVFQQAQAEAYVKALKKEIELMAEGHTGRTKVNTLYLGGGSPALIADSLAGIIDTVKRYFEITEGIGIELHPSDVTEERLRTLKNAGVTRISIGIQSFNEDLLETLGRGETDFDMMFDALKQVPFETVAMDFIFALPGQTVESITQDIDMALSKGANHIALYPFIDFTYTKRSFPKVPEKHKKKLLAGITEHCARCGLIRDSIWTFAKPGTQKYSSMTRDNFLGFGCSATTLLNDQFKINTFAIQDYIDRIQSGQLPTSLTLKFSRRQRMLYYLFWTAYTTVVDEKAFHQFFGKKLSSYYGLELFIARMLGLVRKEGSRHILTDQGAYYYHYYENYYTLTYIDKMWNRMRNEAFPEQLTIR